MDDAARRQKIEQLGDELFDALRARRTLTPLTERWPEIRIEDAYHVSLRMVNRRIEDDGEQIIGKKIGVTSRAVQEMLGVFQPDFGYLTDKMLYPNGGPMPISEQLIQPRAEGEIAFKLKKDLEGPGVTNDDVLDATDYVMACFEVVDSRVHDWKVKIQDTVADNASCGLFVLGDEHADPRGLDFPNLKMRVYKNGELLSEGLGSAALDSPRQLRELARQHPVEIRHQIERRRRGALRLAGAPRTRGRRRRDASRSRRGRDRFGAVHLGE